MDTAVYEKYLKDQFVKNESLCKRCGKCCGVNSDPCVNLIAEAPGIYACGIYDNRLGPQRTVSGKDFTCVPIKDSINRGFYNSNCPYC